MPDSSLGLFILIIALAIGFGVVNGFNDAANAIATVIGTRVLSPRNAVMLAAVFNFTGAATGLAVARTIGKGILVPEAISYLTMIAALASVIIWTTLATYRGLPVSITHGFVAAMAAAGFAVVGSEAVVWSVMGQVLSAVVSAPVLGFTGGFMLMVSLFWIFRRSAPERVRSIFSKFQIISSAFVAYAHGKNDGQMPIGVMTMALVVYTGRPELWDNLSIGNSETWWIIVISALAISSGMAIGGWRVIKTLGLRVTTLRPVHGFAAQASGAAVIEVASQLGIPVSTTHCVSTAIMGVGATRRLSAVRWGVAGNIIAAWIITFPVCGGLGYLFAWLLKPLF
ncbi:MAG: inorganic phosphate transporter [Dehalococcoidia bacterium]|nr:MAG: inorganic phosphate transporter [Dehalococcoidia bacterium]